jgi:hypothetical protein
VTRLDQAVRAARRVRRALVRWRRNTDLGGDCAIAALLVASAIGDLGSLRHHDLSFKSWSPHVWNEIDGVIVDVTASQFNDYDEFQPYVRGVLVTSEPRIFHAQITGTGAATMAFLEQRGWSWYDDAEDEYRRFRRAIVAARKLQSRAALLGRPTIGACAQRSSS